MDSTELVILLLNVAIALGFGIPLARAFCRTGVMGSEVHKSLGLLLVIYFIEGVAFMGSMATSIMSIALAILWGVLLGLKLREKKPTREMVLKLSGVFALYTSLPAVSFVYVPVACALSGWSVTSVGAGHSFGIPEFVPWPMNTILGFCVAVAFGTLIMKVVLTVAIARGLAVRRRGRTVATT